MNLIHHTINLPASKSESNRALIIQALARWQTGADITLQNLSEANDTVVLRQILENLPTQDATLDAQDAGTTFRFLTAFLAITGKQCTLTGTPRMQERPIGVLVEALRTLGATIEYVGKEGYPPLRFAGFEQRAQTLNIQADVSSQYISALLLVAPALPQGLRLRLVGKVASKPYIEMTLQQMMLFGIKPKVDWEKQTIQIAPKPYKSATFSVESDWSAASYWYSAMALLTPELACGISALTRALDIGKMNLLLKGLRADSLQGDKILAELMPFWSIKSTFTPEGVVLSNVSPTLPPKYEIDFANCPDLAQTIITLIAHYLPPSGAWQVRYPKPPQPWSVEYPEPVPLRLLKAWRFTGLESLRIKETDRLVALQNELAKFGIAFQKVGENSTGSEIWGLYTKKRIVSDAPIPIETYHDHRMAMSFAPVQLLQRLDIQNPHVVRKSYPNFWNEWQDFHAFAYDFVPALHPRKQNRLLPPSS